MSGSSIVIDVLLECTIWIVLSIVIGLAMVPFAWRWLVALYWRLVIITVPLLILIGVDLRIPGRVALTVKSRGELRPLLWRSEVVVRFTTDIALMVDLMAINAVFVVWVRSVSCLAVQICPICC